MISYFLTGLIVGILLGLALAPFVRAWIQWRQERFWEEREQAGRRR